MSANGLSFTVPNGNVETSLTAPSPTLFPLFAGERSKPKSCAFTTSKLPEDDPVVSARIMTSIGIFSGTFASKETVVLPPMGTEITKGSVALPFIAKPEREINPMIAAQINVRRATRFLSIVHRPWPKR